MKRMFLAAGMALVLAIPAFVATGGVAHADGATVVTQTSCHITGTVQYCSTMRAEANTTIAASGNVSRQQNGTSTYTATDLATNTVLFSEAATFHFHSLYKDGQLFEMDIHNRDCFTSGGVSDMIAYDYHSVNGRVQYNTTTDTPGC